mmetsp:Transcript_23343/g.57442  ORF Transcript_23343/g.57442 Transcript_23343/m.57442 type:complete len:174 (-) Transcript_23343:273-794(-)
MKKRLSTDRVISLGAGLILFGMTGFYAIPGMIADGAGGSKLNNSFYCSVMSLTTVGFGDICPGEMDIVGRIFLTILPLFGLGFFCGPIMDLASSWQTMVPGGAFSVGSLTLMMGVTMLTTVEELSYSEAVHLCVITGESEAMIDSMRISDGEMSQKGLTWNAHNYCRDNDWVR